jgi:hypothetical protein
MDNRITDIANERPMFRTLLLFFGVGMLALWIIALATDAVDWFAWVDAIFGAIALYVGGVLHELRDRTATATAGLLAMGVIILWIVGLATGVDSWLTWVSFGLALALLAGVMLRGSAFARRTFGTTNTPRTPSPGVPLPV